MCERVHFTKDKYVWVFFKQLRLKLKVFSLLLAVLNVTVLERLFACFVVKWAGG